MSFPSPTKTYHTEAYAAIDLALPALSSKGKNVVISGGGSGIGPEIAKAYAISGASTIALLGRTEKTLLSTKTQVESASPGTKCYFYVADVVDKEAVKRSLADYAAAVGSLHVLVANAGFMPNPGSISESSPEDWFNAFEVNVKGNYNLTRAFLPHAMEDAVILNVTTGALHIPYIPKFSGYTSSKMAAARLFEYLHHEQPDKFVLNVHPGVIKTAMGDKAGLEGVPFDNVNLPAAFVVWASSAGAKFLNGKFIWASWDVDELKAMATKLSESNDFTLGLLGWPPMERGPCDISLTFKVLKATAYREGRSCALAPQNLPPAFNIMTLTNHEDTALSVDSRRRRGKLAQRRYRERQVNRIKELEAQLESHHAAANKQDSSNRAVSETSEGFRPELGRPEWSFETLMKIFLRVPEALPHLHRANDWALMQWLSPEAVGGGRFSPRLTYGILGMPSAGLQVALRQPPSDILPYLTDQTGDFARVLYWQTMDWSYETGQELYHLSQQRQLKLADLETHALAATFLAGGMKAVLARLDFRLGFYRQGAVPSDHEGNDQAAFRSLHRKMLFQLQRQNINMQEYLDATEVESLLQQHLHVLEPGWRPSGNHGDHSAVADELVSRLKSVAICLGEGPRWRQDVVLAFVHVVEHNA
ncbi:hypothetical protein LTS10_010009 [Elasticomyces elasticus]|nr:hypothetical protein LTS10_010009 [Elasticomyces elasticus]